MKKLISGILFLLSFISVQSQVKRTDMLQNMENSQNQQVTATLKSASRLFEAKDDLTSVIMIIPIDSVVNVLGSDSLYLKVSFQENEGYIFRHDATLNSSPVEIAQPNQVLNQQQPEQPSEQRKFDRFSYLENKYGTNMAALLAAGKIWKGMSAEMVKDSWGSPLKINRVIGSTVTEDWIFKNTWLFIVNNALTDWGPVKR